MIVLMAGLPGTGKSTLAQALAARTSGAVLNKDIIRQAIFAPEDIEYSTAQDDFCQELMLVAAAYLVSKNRDRLVFLDGRPFSCRYQIEQVIQAAAALNQPWHILECVCSDETAISRIEAQAGEHPAENRDHDLFVRVKARFEEITSPKTTINTDQPIEICVDAVLRALKAESFAWTSRTQSGT
jgi:adenylylsulfate kinase